MHDELIAYSVTRKQIRLKRICCVSVGCCDDRNFQWRPICCAVQGGHRCLKGYTGGHYPLLMDPFSRTDTSYLKFHALPLTMFAVMITLVPGFGSCTRNLPCNWLIVVEGRLCFLISVTCSSAFAKVYNSTCSYSHSFACSVEACSSTAGCPSSERHCYG